MEIALILLLLLDQFIWDRSKASVVVNNSIPRKPFSRIETHYLPIKFLLETDINIPLGILISLIGFI